jgi:hypothetical protein
MASPESQSVAVMMPSLQLRQAGDDSGLVRVHGFGDAGEHVGVLRGDVAFLQE